MNIGILRFILGRLLIVTGTLLLLPAAVGAIYGESDGLIFLIMALITALLGGLLARRKPKTREFYAREGFVATSLSWILMSLVGALPFTLSGVCPSYIDALFETVSGFTTTGGSILTSLDGISYCVHFWRCFTHWIGGMGVLVFILAILPMADGYGMHLMRAESPGPKASKLVPKLGSTAKILYVIYMIITVLEILALFFTGMPVFDCFTITFSTVGTGGFALTGEGVAAYSTASQIVITVFMIVCSINFNAYFLLFIGRSAKAFKLEEVRAYLLMVFGAAAMIAVNLVMCGTFTNPFEAFHHALFNVSSISSTTGFASKDFNLWPEFSRSVLMILCMIGACAGSTGGGFKVSRLLILLKSARNEIVYVIHRKSVRRVHMDGKSIEEQTVKSVAAYAVLYFAIFVVSFLMVSADGFDFSTNLTSVAATLNNVGPGLNMVGPAGNYAQFSVLSKLVFIFNMLAGRLEILPMLILFRPSTWRKNS
ncbi:MAG: TrkH family potassium uptake protein [Lachnospiraceae bacterium]|nr:TrkH family potassium uptake protein [Lachnospiraceae bacterium]